MGSKNSDPRQIDGVGGATSTTSKVAIVASSQRPGIDVEYTFAQVAVGRDRVDYSGNCGNIASGVGPFALQEGLVRPEPGQRQMDIRIFNTNTSRTLVETVEVDEEGGFEEDGDYEIAGVKGSGSQIEVAFMNPAGSMTGRLFPTGNREDIIIVNYPQGGGGPFSVRASLVDAANPFIFVDASTMPLLSTALELRSLQFLAIIEDIRRAGAVLFGLASSTDAAADVRGTPKIALVSRPTAFPSNTCCDRAPDIHIIAFSMGLPHPSLQLTGAVCLGAAISMEGTVPYRIAASHLTLPPTPEPTPSPPDLGHYTPSKYDKGLWKKEICIEHNLLALAGNPGVQRFGCVRTSGGGTYLLECYHKIPRARLKAAGVVADILIAAGLGWALGKAARDTKRPEAYAAAVAKSFELRSEADRIVWRADKGGLHEILLESIREAVQERSQGPAYETKLYRSD
ncbi:hypothetical protein W97_07729 [Coniosporium apollinis CBS 100218]|uniref:Methylitaconate delta2-delta3-isomerase n=1 Tax=Coniosporium apollinis (strain CBS 100218) TaxID=1168221 RepID=R7Z2I3_CONA1|nr:uncharacterized protein W97_07729 [Coniosporium apollinis CBS 100218]EON68405.1 hypothetical protein W97_07729 [Coniosporium apollinis CBS 100218]